jgi:hypothetical protein
VDQAIGILGQAILVLVGLACVVLLSQRALSRDWTIERRASVLNRADGRIAFRLLHLVGRQIRAAGRAASDDAGWVVLVEDLQ